MALSGQGGEISTDLSLSHVWIGDADLDQGGEMGSRHTSLRVDMDRSLGRGESIGLSLGAVYRSHDFSGSSDLMQEEPWDKVTEYSVGLNWRRPAGEAGMLFFAPSLEFARGDGADWGDSLRGGAILSYGHRFSDSLTIGVGAGVFSGLEETQGFPVLLIDWRINESWRIGNPFRPGPTGPAGLEVVYTFAPEWEIALGGGWRSNRFRLDENGPNPDGIGEVEGFPAFLRLSWRASETISLDLYGGMFLEGELTYEDSDGDKIAEDDLDSAPMAGISLTARF
ncbi:MAG: DUF6268 family outer membrane beta-barrel protein [Oceanipulchritudo sp.]